MQMNIQELATAVVYELPVIICIWNNGYLGNVRQWQEMFYGKRYFIRLAESYGAKGIRVTREAEIAPALQAAKRTAGIPTVIEFIIDREDNVMPIVPPGNALEEMVLKEERI